MQRKFIIRAFRHGPFPGIQSASVGLNFASVSYYINKARVAEYFKDDDSSLLAEFKRSRFLVFVDKQPLLQRSSASSSGYFIPLISHTKLSQISTSLGFSYDDTSIALIDVVPMQSSTNDTYEEFLPVFALDLRSSSTSPDSSRSKQLETALSAELVDVRRAWFLINDPSSLKLLAKGQSLLRWARNTKFCMKCAAPLKLKVSKASATCTTCSAEFYPTISPVAITLISNEKNDHALLVRQPRHPSNLFTAVAGFAEPGESLEDTVRREVAEEVGVDLSTIKYADVSQPWPYPQLSLMCGFFSTVHGMPEPSISKSELEDGDWFPRSDVEKAFLNSVNFANDVKIDKQPNQKILFVPPPGAVAHELIKRWLNETR